MSFDTWASDTPPSRPVPPPTNTPVLLDFEGFGFTVNGMVHNISESDLESMMVPTFAPQGFLNDLPLGRFDRERDSGEDT